MINEKRTAALRLFGDRFLCLALRANKQNGLALPRHVAHKAACLAEHLQSLLQINNVNAVALAENVLLHLRVPTTRLVTEMNAGLQKFLHCNFNCHLSSLLDSCFSRRPVGVA